MARRKSLAEYLGFIGLGCFGVKILDSDLDTDTNLQTEATIISGMNIRANHAALEQRRSDVQDDGSGKSPTRIMSDPESPELVPLREMLRRQDRMERNPEVGSLEYTYMCCVCMGRKNRSVLIPCGHTFCGKCSKKLCFDHGTCPMTDCQYPFCEFIDIMCVGTDFPDMPLQ